MVNPKFSFPVWQKNLSFAIFVLIYGFFMVICVLLGENLHSVVWRVNNL